MPAPAARYKLLPARGAYASLAAALADIAEGEIVYATDQDLYYQKEGGVLTPVGVPEAPNDGTQYVRQNQSWAAVEVPPGTIIGTSAALPGTIEIGQLWYDTETARTFVYTGTEWADASPDAANATVITADNPPANPEDGDLWFDTSDGSGRLYVYYVDTDSSQWIDASPDSTGEWVRDDATGTVSPATAGDSIDLGTGDLKAADAQVASLNGGQLAGFRNQLRNPYFAVFQRSSPVTVGTSYASSFGADGWSARTTAATGGSTTLTAGTPGGSIMSTYMSQANTGHTDYFYLRQKIESVTTLAGQTATLTVRLQTSVNFTLSPALLQVFGTGGSADVSVNSNEGGQAVTTGGIRTLSWTFNVPSIAGKTVNPDDDYLSVSLRSTGAVNGTIEWIAAQLEPGSVSTPLELRPVSVDLALCQRYYQANSNLSYIVEGNAAASGAYTQQANIITPMRAAPTPTITTSLTSNTQAAGLTAPTNDFIQFTVRAAAPGRYFMQVSSYTLDAEL